MLTLNILCIFMLRFPSEIWVSLDKKCPYSELFWYEVSLLIQSECGKMRTRVTANKDNFHSVCSSMLDEGMKSVNYIRISHKNSEIFSKSCHGVFGINLNKTFYLITHFMSLVSFYAPWKYQKTRYLFSWGGGGIERDQWYEMGWERAKYVTLMSLLHSLIQWCHTWNM